MQIIATDSRSLREKVADQLRHLIVTGELKPGQCLSDTELSGLLNTSRGPVREALLLLEKELLVRNSHNRGWFVIELAPDEVSQLISLRLVLETVALREAAERVTPAGLVEVRRLFGLLFEFARRDQMVDLLRADFEFHQCIWDLAGHSQLRDELIRICAPYFAYMQATLRRSPIPPGHFDTTISQHQHIVEYLENPGRKKVEEVLAQHFQTLGVAGWDRLLERTTAPAANPASNSVACLPPPV